VRGNNGISAWSACSEAKLPGTRGLKKKRGLKETSTPAPESLMKRDEQAVCRG